MAGVRSKPRTNGKYQGWFVNYSGARVFFTGTHSRTETRRIAEKLEDEHRGIRLGYRPVPAATERHRGRPVAEVVQEYLAWGNAQGGRGGRPWGAEHGYMRGLHLKWWTECLELHTLADLHDCLSRVESALRELSEGGKAGKTVNNHAEALRAFARWAEGRGFLSHNPLKGLRKFDDTPTMRRRAMTGTEIEALLEHCPPERRMLYRVALASGLRARELRSLTVADLDIERGGLQLHAAWTKNRKPGLQPLPKAMLRELAETADGKEPGEPLLHVPYHPSEQFKADLKRADIPQCTAEGKLDFHALRTTYVTLVIESGATVKEAQALARHATPGLTLNGYARTRPARLLQVTEKLGETLPRTHEKCATGVHKLAAGAEGLALSDMRCMEIRKEQNGGRTGTRTRNLLLVRQAL